eukprot:COSAG05_NODE_1488_length_4726_cov_9.016641_4_plen_89_part_00
MLYNIALDPLEQNDLARSQPQKVTELLARMAVYAASEDQVPMTEKVVRYGIVVPHQLGWIWAQSERRVLPGCLFTCPYKLFSRMQLAG